ncbi:MarR family winged helix-turn-helix transcriptional regulator [Azospirillum brasilense]|uniref:MarR family winged helix-turn-helix transcriptional regulator n=1 Tax=Azospirillum brasilense TaxID=192 RepID=UPI000E699C62|nr:MarR family transcriptional regulator [Azospirillum brasilense]NUB24180.1 MarR family transcriptional regulator [Azospirillum brasilense]NUB30470.1 MarR family transcriptional regulator [Azospirillum brasilense]RIW04229.1 MarR family transcriptional regulator [Azospirillum brasilense]
MAETNVSPLDAHLGYWLRFVSNHVSHAFAAKLAGRGVTVAEWVVLRDLYGQDGMAPSLLADRLGMTRGAISKLADRLAAKGLLTQTADPDDRRYQTLALTPEGRALVPDLSALADRNDAEFFGHLDPAERARVEDTLKVVVRRMGLRSVPID